MAQDRADELRAWLIDNHVPDSAETAGRERYEGRLSDSPGAYELAGGGHDG